MRPPLLSVWAPLSPAVYLRRSPGSPPFPLGEDGHRLYGWGRQALFAGVQALGLGGGDEVLVPAYHHGSEVQAVIAAGLTPRFYEGGEDLAPLEEELDALIGPRTRALLLIHYLGFPQDGARWRAWCDERGLLFLEDAAQAWLSRYGQEPVGSLGDLGVFCLYKMVGLPEGAALVSRTPPPDPGLDRRLGLLAVGHRHAAWVAHRSRLLTTARAVLSRDAEYDPEADFALRDHADSAWRCVPTLLRRIDYEAAVARRRAHYELLSEALEGRVPAPFDRLPAGASPFALPVSTEDKAGLLRALEAQGVEALDFWSVPHPSLPVDDFPAAASRRGSTLCLPVHQELREADLERIARAAGAR